MGKSCKGAHGGVKYEGVIKGLQLVRIFRKQGLSAVGKKVKRG